MTQTDQQNVPKLRFPGFEEAWESKPLSSSFPKIRNGFVGTATPFYQNPGVTYLQGKNIKSGVLDVTNTVTVSEAFHTKQSKSKVKPYDILMVQSGHVGECAYVPENIGEANCHALVVMTPTADAYSPFFVYYFYAEAGQRHIYKITTGNTIQHILTSDLKPLAVATPTLPEQRKIAGFLGAVDTKIAQLADKKRLLEDYKKGCMQQLFSQKIRFKDDTGNDFPDWEEKRVSDVFRITRGQVLAVPKMTQTPEGNSTFPVYSSQTKNNGLTGYFTEYLFEDAITWTTDGANAGEVQYRSGKFYCTNVCGVLLSDEGNANACVAAMLNRVTEKYVSYVGNPKLMNNVMGGIKIAFPHPEEQRKIADFLSALDRKIDLLGQELTHARSFKQGLLQQMFV